MKQLADTLAVISQLLAYEELITYILAGLDSNYDSLVTSVTTSTDAMSLGDLYAHLLSFEIRLAYNNNVDLGGASANSSPVTMDLVAAARDAVIAVASVAEMVTKTHQNPLEL